MPRKKQDPTPTVPKIRKPKTFAPEIVEARAKCATLRDEIEINCKQIMANARQAAAVRRLTEAMTPEQREALRKSLEAKRVGFIADGP